MKDPNDMTKPERYNEVERLALLAFGERWKTTFARRYGTSRNAVHRWSHEGAPLWPVLALRDALTLREAGLPGALTVEPIAPPA